jgi:hypothetical protein
MAYQIPSSSIQVCNSPANLTTSMYILEHKLPSVDIILPTNGKLDRVVDSENRAVSVGLSAMNRMTRPS